MLVGVLVTGLLVAAAVAYVLPWLVPLAVANAWPLLGVAAAVAVLAAVDRLVRPWFVELQRQGLADAPRRVWRVRGWRRSARLMDEVAAAVRDGRIDQRHAAVLFRPGEGERPADPAAAPALQAAAAAAEEEQDDQDDDDDQQQGAEPHDASLLVAPAYPAGPARNLAWLRLSWRTGRLPQTSVR